jgi:hypothetical protein
MSEAYMTINTFSQLLMVFAQTLLLFSSDQSTDDTHSLLFFSFLFFSFAGTINQ